MEPLIDKDVMFGTPNLSARISETIDIQEKGLR